MRYSKFQYFLTLFVIILATAACNVPGGSDEDPTATIDANQSIETSVAQTVAAQGSEDGEGDTSGDGEGGGDSPSEEADSPEEENTATPTVTQPPEPTATPSIPVIHVSVDTNCRYGPGIVYDPPVTYLPAGEPAQVLGKDPNGDFYYIDKNCYVWTNYVTVEAGNINSVPIFTPMPTPTPGITFAGTWETACANATCGDLTLEINGDQVTGSYADGDGEIEGTLVDNHIAGIWERNGFTGTIDFWLSDDGQNWIGNYDGNTAWCGVRPDGTLPNPCKLATWYGTWETNCAAGTCDQLVIVQNRYKITGTYANGDGTIEGTAEIDVLIGTWFRNNLSGTIGFYMRANGEHFQGNYGGSSAWCGSRDGLSYPNPCKKP